MGYYPPTRVTLALGRKIPGLLTLKYTNQALLQKFALFCLFAIIRLRWDNKQLLLHYRRGSRFSNLYIVQGLFVWKCSLSLRIFFPENCLQFYISHLFHFVFGIWLYFAFRCNYFSLDTKQLLSHYRRGSRFSNLHIVQCTRATFLEIFFIL